MTDSLYFVRSCLEIKQLFAHHVIKKLQ